MGTKKKTRKTNEERWREKAVRVEQTVIAANTFASCRGDFVMQFAKKYARALERQWVNTL